MWPYGRHVNARSGPERWVGLVRNVMLGREGLHRDVLLELVAAAGGAEPRSYLTTGNVTFAAEAVAVTDVVAEVEASLATVIGRGEIVAVRSRSWLRELAERDPFRAYDAARWNLEAAFLPAYAPPLADVHLEGTASTRVVEVGPRELLVARLVDGPRGPHANPLLERLSGARATSRGWSTLLRLAQDRQAE